MEINNTFIERYDQLCLLHNYIKELRIMIKQGSPIRLRILIIRKALIIIRDIKSKL